MGSSLAQSHGVPRRFARGPNHHSDGTRIRRHPTLPYVVRSVADRYLFLNRKVATAPALCIECRRIGLSENFEIFWNYYRRPS